MKHSGIARIVVAAAMALLATACVSTGVKSYEGFQNAVKAGASCQELFDIKSEFEGSGDLKRSERDLNEIGCKSPSSTRTDR